MNPRSVFRDLVSRRQPRKLPLPVAPQIVCPTGAWRVTPTGGAGTTDFVRRLMSTPVERTRHARAVQMHENSHARWSPTPEQLKWLREKGATDEAIHACEEPRIELLGIGAGVDVIAHALQDRELACFSNMCKDPKVPARLIAQFYLAAHSQKLGSSVRRMVGKRDASIGKRCKRILALLDHSPGPGSMMTLLKMSILFDGLFPKDPPKDLNPNTGVDNELTERIEYARDNSPPVWGEMLEYRLPLTHPYSAHIDARRHRRTYAGSTLKRLDRLAFGVGKAFERKRRVQGGTVLVDFSGSMGEPKNTIDYVLENLPGARIAGYACAHPQFTYEHSEFMGKGILGIVAEKGRTTKLTTDNLRNYFGGRNLVDGPALRWLARQPGPRFWVSDGGVNGLSGCGWLLLEECKAICKASSIARVDPSLLD